MNAAIAKFMQAFPEMSQSTIMLVITLPSLISMPVMLFIGSIVGKKVNYKTIAVLAPLLAKSVPEEKLSAFTGYGMAIMSGRGALLGILVGMLAETG